MIAVMGMSLATCSTTSAPILKWRRLVVGGWKWAMVRWVVVEWMLLQGFVGLRIDLLLGMLMRGQLTVDWGGGGGRRCSRVRSGGGRGWRTRNLV